MWLRHDLRLSWTVAVVVAALMAGLSIPLGLFGVSSARAVGPNPSPSLNRVWAPPAIVPSVPTGGIPGLEWVVPFGDSGPAIPLYSFTGNIYVEPYEGLRSFLRARTPLSTDRDAAQRYLNEVAKIVPDMYAASPSFRADLDVAADGQPLPDTDGRYGTLSDGRILRTVDGRSLHVSEVITPADGLGPGPTRSDTC